MPLKIMGIFFIVVLLIIIPVCAVFAPVVYIGSLFGNTLGTMKENFGSEYDQNFTEKLDSFVYENRISVDYNAVTACVLYDMKDDPEECLTYVNKDTGTFSKDYPDILLEVKEKEHIGKYDDSFFADIHVLGKHTVSKYEAVGSHKETILTGYDTSGTVPKPMYEEVEVDDYDWVYYPEIHRGKCIDSDTVSCHIILEDQDVYPYQLASFILSKHYGIHVDPESYEITLDPYQEWSGDMIYAFSKGTVVSASSDEIVLKIDANDIDLYARYESIDGLLFPEFDQGQTVEATEVLAYSEGDTRLYLYNSKDEFINPAVFVSSGSGLFSGLGEGTVIPGMEDFAPDFSNRKVWLGYKDGGINPYGDAYMGQCTWFAWGLFYQHCGFDPGFRGNGSSCASEAYHSLKEQGWTFSRSPSPGAVFSTTNFNHVGIVAGVLDGDTMIIVEGNFNHRNDTFAEFISLPDWAMRTVSVHYYKKGVGYVFCNPPQ